MAGAAPCRKAFLALSPSHWVYAIGLNCDDALWVWFNHGQRIILRLPQGPGRYIGIGGAPAVCCLYPGTAGQLGRNLFDLASVWSFAGEFERAFLYKQYPYVITAPPVLPCAGCGNQVSLSSSFNPSVVGQTVTFVATVSNRDGGSTPTGTITFTVNGVQAGTIPLIAGVAVLTYSFSMAGSYTVLAIYNPDAGWQAGQASVVQVVQARGVGHIPLGE